MKAKKGMFSKLQVGEKTTKLYMATICNGKPCGIETRNQKVGSESNYYKVGIEIRKTGCGDFIMETWTIFEGKHILNCHIISDINGQIVDNEKSMVNCFNLGWSYADQSWVDALIDEMAVELVAKRRRWDSIE